MTEKLNIAVLGDLHGHFTLAFTLLKRWENETGMSLDLILQVGDLGAFPDLMKIDQATYRFAQKDPDELSFPDYLNGKGEAKEFFDYESPDHRRIDAPLIWIAGNHEDFEYIEELSTARKIPVPVDYYARLQYLPDGEQTQFKCKDVRINIGSLSRLEYSKHEQAMFSSRDLTRLMVTPNIDILLTHEPPYDGQRGSERIKHLIRGAQPIYHFCGHWHETGHELDEEAPTRSYVLNGVSHRGQKLNENCIGILEWRTKTNNKFSFLNEPWMKEYTRDNFRRIRGQ